MLAINKQKN